MSSAHSSAEVFALQGDWPPGAFPLEQRRHDLLRLELAVQAAREELRAALAADFGKPEAEVDLSELYPVVSHARHTRRRLRAWMRPRRVESSWPGFGSRARVVPEPKGRALVLAPWNYPVALTLLPLTSALAAGNRVVLKPSELVPHTSAALAQLVEDTFEPEQVALVQGGPEVARELMAQPFDHVYFTGSPRIGRLVAKAAAEHLASVTLELGGKSPVIVAADADVGLAVKRIVNGKLLNAGQTCVAPDYVLVDERLHDELVEALHAELRSALGPDEEAWRASPDLARMVDERSAERLSGLLDEGVAAGARIACGGAVEVSERYVSPTLLTDVADDSPLMAEELFGPLLPVQRYRELDAALARIRARPHPLALYAFTNSRATFEQILRETRAGGTLRNATVEHFANWGLGFGGVGESGTGRAHGRAGFDAFSNPRGVQQPWTERRPAAMLERPWNRPSVRRLLDLALRRF